MSIKVPCGTARVFTALFPTLWKNNFTGALNNVSGTEGSTVPKYHTTGWQEGCPQNITFQKPEGRSSCLRGIAFHPLLGFSFPHIVICLPAGF